MERWKFKEFTKIIIIVGVIYLVFFYGFMILCNVFTEYSIKEALNPDMLFIVLRILSVYFAILLFLFMITRIHRMRHEIKAAGYFRDIDEKTTPAMAALLIYNYLEDNEVMLATILDLKVKKYINIVQKDNKMEINLTNKSEELLFEHEKYVLECIKKKEIVKLYEFKKILVKDCVEEGLIQEKVKSGKIELILLLTCFIGFFVALWLGELVSSNMKKILWILYGCLFFITLIRFNWIPDLFEKRMTKGESLAINMKKLKNFLKEYTLLNYRDIEFINIVDRYFAFALALGEARKLEKLYVPYNELISNYIEQGDIL